MRLWVNGRQVWKLDANIARPGRQWQKVDVTAHVKPDQPIELRFGVVTAHRSKKAATLALLGPVRLYAR